MTDIKNDYKYQPGFGNHFSSEALPDALPKGTTQFWKKQ
jgi:homogentisate 1,2-dioxygenase